MGDGGIGGDPGKRSHDPKNLLGKMLRIDVNTEQPYLIPSDNPWATNTDTLPEIWAFGLRNPWRFSFDRLTGDLWIGDVGQNKWEEINFTKKGTPAINYGWRCYEGNDVFNSQGCKDVSCLFYTSDAADERSSVDLVGRRIIKKKNSRDVVTCRFTRSITRLKDEKE